MKVIESFVEGKFGDLEKCEDAIIVTDNYAGVIDGASSKVDMLFDGKTSGKVASEIIAGAIAELPSGIGWEEVLARISNKINEFYEKKDLVKYIEDNPAARAQAAVAIYSESLKEVCMIADCQCMINDVLYFNPLVMDQIRVNTRALYLESELRLGKTTEELLEKDTGAEFIKPLLLTQHLFKNTSGSQYSYGVVDGLRIPEEEIKIVKVPEGTKGIVLTSDGYPVIKDTLKETEDELHRIIKEDPLCIKMNKQFRGVGKGLVSYDDRAYLRIWI